jgi:hypothetical protein
MIILSSTSDKLQVITSAAATVDVHASWIDNANGAITPGRSNTAISTATTTDIVGAPGAGTLRDIETVHIRNKHASTACDVTVQHTDGTIVSQMHKLTLTAGMALQYVDGEGFLLAPTTSYQPLDTELTALATTTSAADTLPYFNGSGTATTTPLSSFGRTLIDDADAATARATIGAVNKVGDTMTGALTIAFASGAAQFNISPASGLAISRMGYITGQGAVMEIRNTTTPAVRWKWWYAYNNETGSNTGSDFGLERDDDTGASQGYVFTINRASGLFTHNNGLAFGSQLGSTTGDLSKHISLYGGIWGFNITAGQMNFVGNGAQIAYMTTSGLNLLLTPTAPTATAGTNTTQIATTAFVASAVTGNVDTYNAGRLTYLSATALKFAPYGGRFIEINGAVLQIPNAGIAGLANTSVYVNGVAAQNLAANTTYYVYAFNNAGTITADFRTDGNGHLTDTTAGNEGVEVRCSTGTTADSTRTLIGLIRTNASSQFVDSYAQRFVRSWFNRKPAATINYFAADRTTSSTTTVEINSEIRNEVLILAGESWLINIAGNISNNTTGARTFAGIGVDNAVGQQSGTYFHSSSANQAGACSATDLEVSLTEGYHYSTVVGNASTGTSTYYGTLNRCVALSGLTV